MIRSFSRRGILPVAILLTAVALLIYADTFEAPFVFDDLPNITGNPRVRMTRLTPTNLTAILKIQPDNRPLAYTTFALNYYLGRYDVSGYHIVNLVIHILTALLVYLVARQTLRLCGTDTTTAPFLAAVLWLVNPVHTQSVTYIVQRMNSLAAMFSMLALFCYIRARMAARAGQGRVKRFLFYALCLLAAVLGLASKQIVIILPAFLLLYEWFFFQNLDRAWLKRQLRWIVAAVILLTVIILVYLQGSIAERLAILYEKNDFTAGQRLLTETRVIVYYLSLLLFPHPARLNVDYDFPLSFSLADPAVTVLALLALGALLTAALYKPDRHRLLSFTILWFLGNLVIESSFLKLALMYEYRTYIPSLFPVFFFTALLLRYLPRPVAVTGLILMIIISCAWTYQRNAVWGDSLTLWQDTARKSPHKGRPANGVGMAYQTHGQSEIALEWFQKAVRLDPEYDVGFNNIGSLLVKLGRPTEGLSQLERAIALNPESHEAFSNLGSAMKSLNRIDEAMTYYQKSISLYPDYEIAQNNLGAVLMEKGDLEGAIRHLHQAIRINPGYNEPYNNLGLVMVRLGKTEAAISFYRKGLLLNPDSGSTHFNLATVLFQQQNLDGARYHLQEAVRIDPSSILALNNLATVLVLQRQYEEAIAALNRLAELRPESPTVYYNLACANALGNNKEAAVNALKKAVSRGYDRWNHMKTDPDLKNIYDTDYFRALTQSGGMAIPGQPIILTR